MGQIIYKGDAYNDGIKDIEMNLAVTGDVPVNGESIETTVDTTTNPEKAVISANIPAGISIENGVIVNDGNAVVQGDEVTTEVVRKDGYINVFGDAGNRFICLYNNILMGPVKYVTYEEILKHLLVYNEESSTWDLVTDEQEAKNIFNYFREKNIFYENPDNDTTRLKIFSSEITYSNNKYKIEDIIVTQPSDEYALKNILKPSDLYSFVPLETNCNPTNSSTSGFFIEIVSADEYYYNIMIRNGSIGTVSADECSYYIKVPRTAKVIGMFLYCSKWNNNGAYLQMGVAGFNDFNDQTAQLVSFIPLGFLKVNSNYSYFDGNVVCRWTDSKEYEYAANITKRYTYIDKATYETATAEGTT